MIYHNSKRRLRVARPQVKSSAAKSYFGMSTILPATAELIANAHQERARHYVSGAVLGVPKTAASGELTIFCSGESNHLGACEAVLKTFAQSIIYLDPQPKASLVMKISMNYALITTIELISELYVFSEKSGLDLEIIQKGLHQIYAHPAYKRYVDKIKERDFDQVNFDLKGGYKDVSVFQQAFATVGGCT